MPEFRFVQEDWFEIPTIQALPLFYDGKAYKRLMCNKVGITSVDNHNDNPTLLHHNNSNNNPTTTRDEDGNITIDAGNTFM